MKKTTPYFKQATFYLSTFALILSTTAITLYALNCPSEFNGGVVSKAVVFADVVAIVAMVIAIAANIAEYYFTDKPMLIDIFSYKRFLTYVAFVSLLYSLFMGILAEYSLIGTILYPIVSGTVGDPVDPVLSSSYFINLVGTLFAVIMTSIVALVQRSRFYKAEKMIGDAYENV